MNLWNIIISYTLNGDGRASPELRARAFSNTDVPSPLQGLISKVATNPAQITDATGSGDVLAAGLLAILASDAPSIERGVRLGAALATHKLRHIGASGHQEFPGIAEDALRECR